MFVNGRINWMEPCLWTRYNSRSDEALKDCPEVAPPEHKPAAAAAKTPPACAIEVRRYRSEIGSWIALDRQHPGHSLGLTTSD